MKNILVIGYSQTGQLDEILDNFLQPFQNHSIERIKIQPKTAYPFPWTSAVFFDIMPETVLEEPIDLSPITFQKETYDLIIIAYQPWFLSPSQPTTALFKNQQFLQLLKDTPVATVIGARNMWLNSQESLVKWIQEAGGNLVANIPFIDKVQNHISAFTILHWMLTGKKTKKWGFFPLPGVAQKDIAIADQYAQPLANGLDTNNYKGVQTAILQKGGIDIVPSILLIESKAKRLFRIWANLIQKKGTNEKKRAFWVSFFKWYLVIALFVISPIILIIYTLVVRPLTGAKIKRNKEKYLYLGIEKLNITI